MSIDFTCPHCGKQTVVPDRYAGNTGPCVACGQTITIPAIHYAIGMSPTPVPPKPVPGSWGTPLLTVVGCVLPLLLCFGALVAIFLPALSGTRGRSRRTQCNNNLKNIGLALQNYHDTYKTFPMGAMHAGMRGSSERMGPSWHVGILPFCEQRNMYDKIMSLQRDGAPGNGAFNAENLNANIPGSPLLKLVPDYMRCPDSPLPVMESQAGPIVLPSYVGISGGCDIVASSPDYQGIPGASGFVPPASTQRYLNQRKGVGHVPGGIITASGMLPPCEFVNMARCTDGTSNTMIVGEQSDWLLDVNRNNANKYHGDAGWDTSGTGPATASTTAGGGFVSGTIESTPVPTAIGGMPGSPPAVYDCYNITTVRYPANLKHVLGTTPCPGCSEDHGINNPLQSPHPGGILVAFVDGSVQFISGTTNLAVLLRIAIRDDGQIVKLD